MKEKPFSSQERLLFHFYSTYIFLTQITLRKHIVHIVFINEAYINVVSRELTP